MVNEKALQKIEEMHGMRGKKFVPPPVPEIEQPEEFFTNFFKPYVESKIINQRFVDFYAYRISRKKELPTPQALAADLAELQSGIKNPRQIQFIVEDYAVALNEYLKKSGANASPAISQFGISVPQPGTSFSNESIQMPPTQQYIPLSNPSNPFTPFTLRDYQPQGALTVKDLQIWKLQQEIEQLKKEKEKEKEDETVKMLMQRIEKLEEEKKNLEQQRIRSLEEKLERMEESGKLTRDDIEDIIKQVLKVKEEQLTKKDIEEIIRKHLRDENSRKSNLTKEDLERIKIEKEHELKKLELAEKKAMRENIGKTLKEGFSLLGQAIARTIIETESGEQFPTEGVQTASGLMQLTCPNCGATILASADAKQITCPKCGKTYVVEKPPTPMPEPPPISRPLQEEIIVGPSKEPERHKIPISTPHQKEEDIRKKISEREDIKKKIEDVVSEKGQPTVIQDKDGMWVCPICNKKFRTKNGALGHIRFSHLKKRKNEQ